MFGHDRPLSSSAGKRGRRQPARTADISEIVDRIAPKVSKLPPGSDADRTLVFSRRSSPLKHGRPEAAESALQQWIGDSATIPCTPEVRVSRAKKSPRWVQLHWLGSLGSPC